MQFTAHIIKGSGRGNRIGTPTMNLNLAEIPETLAHGIYACRMITEALPATYDAIVHYGPRLVFKDTVSCEVHLLDIALQETPDTLTVDIIQKLREVRNFPSIEALQIQIQNDITHARAILKTC